MALWWTLAASMTLSVSAPPAVEFFPTAPGSRWVYEDKQGRQTVVLEDRAEDPIGPETDRLIPVSTFQENQRMETTYYRVEGDTVWLEGFDPKKRLDRPYPILKTSGSTTSWTFSGTTHFMQDPVPLTMRGTAKAVRDLKFQGKTLPGIEVRLEATLEVGADTTLRTVQVAKYAKGIGLIEMTETSDGLRNRQTRTRTLVEYRIGR